MTNDRSLNRPRRGPCREALLRQNAAAEAPPEVLTEAELLEAHDGTPLAVGPGTVTLRFCGGAAVTADDLIAVGLTPQDVPNLRVIYAPEPTEYPGSLLGTDTEEDR